MKACATFLPLFTIIVKMFNKRKKRRDVRSPNRGMSGFGIVIYSKNNVTVPKGMILVGENGRKHSFQEARWNYKHSVLDTSD